MARRTFINSKILWILAPLLLGVQAQAECTHYASPDGGGDGSSPASPFHIGDFWNVASPGTTLCLLDGVYTGSNSMINPPDSLNGTDSQRITIRAVNDGGVSIDGQGVNFPVWLHYNDYFVLEGFNAHSGREDVISLMTGADYNTVRRVVAWDACGDQDCDVFGSHGNNGNLFEDVVGFGRGRKIFTNSQAGNGLTIRRAWGMWNEHTLYGNDPGSPKHVYAAAYNSYGATYENVMGTWDGEATGAYAVLGTDGFYRGHDACAGSSYLGSIGYLKSGNTVPDLVGAGYGSRSLDCFEFKDVVLSMAGFSQRPLDASGFDGGSSSDPIDCPVCDRKLTNITEIGDTPSSIATGKNGWTLANRAVGSTVESVPNIWSGAGSDGARVCYRYQDRVLTRVPLWPWPMDSRMRAALLESGRDPDVVFDGRGNGLTEQMEKLFGAIPSECRGTGAPAPDMERPIVSILSPSNGSQVSR